MKHILIVVVALLSSLSTRAERVSTDEIIVDVGERVLEEVIFVGCGSADVSQIPIFFEEAPVFFGDRMLDAMALYGILNFDECEGHRNEWYCSENALNNALSYRGVNAKGEEMDRGYVCSLSDDIPDYRYFNEETFEGLCVEVILNGEDEPSLYYPHDYY